MNSKEITAEDLFIKHFVVAAIKNGETEESAIKMYKENKVRDPEVLSVYLNCMDEYRSQGEQEMAIKFANWMAQNEYQDLEGHWWDGYASSKFYTTEELYEIFKQSL